MEQLLEEISYNLLRIQDLSANSIDPDEVAPMRLEPPHLDICCLLIQQISLLVLLVLKCKKMYILIIFL